MFLPPVIMMHANYSGIETWFSSSYRFFSLKLENVAAFAFVLSIIVLSLISTKRRRKKKIRRILDDTELGEETKRKIAIEKVNASKCQKLGW